MRDEKTCLSYWFPRLQAADWSQTWPRRRDPTTGKGVRKRGWRMPGNNLVALPAGVLPGQTEYLAERERELLAEINQLKNKVKELEDFVELLCCSQ